MNIVCERLRYGARLDIVDAELFQSRYRDALVCVVGGGRGSAMSCQGVAQGVWLPLRGKLQMATGEASFSLEPGQLFVGEPEQRTQASGRGAALWVALIGSKAAWRRTLSRVSGMLVPAPVLMPAWHEARPGLRRQALRIVRAALTQTREEPLLAASEDVISALLELQSDFDTMIDRCPGRTLAQRHQVFLRLQRVRNHMAASCHLDLGVPELARMASYSTWHFIRAFHDVYGETPYAYLVRQRLDRARRLVRSSPLAISEIAQAIGFENRSAFSRLFKQRFGVSAADLRRQHGLSARRTLGRVTRRELDELPLRATSASRAANSGQLAGLMDF